MDQQVYLTSYGDKYDEKCIESTELFEIILKCRCDIVELPPNPELLPFNDLSQATLQAWLISEFRIIDIWLRSIPLVDRIHKSDFVTLCECTFPSIALLRMAFLSRKLENRVYFMPYSRLTSQTSKKFLMNPKLYEGIRKLADEMKTLNCTDITFIALLLLTQPDVECLARKDELEQIHELAMASFLHWRYPASDEYWGKICKIISMLRRQDFIILFLFWMSRGFVIGVPPVVAICKRLMETVGKPTST